MSVIVDKTKAEIEMVIKYARVGANNCMIGHTWEIEELVRCKECKHRTKYDGPNRLIFPDKICPCQCDDCYYNWMPSDDWYCADGERKEQNDE